MSISVVLAGGGCRTAWGVGVLEELRGELPEPREWAGVSAGSCMAVALAARATERSTGSSALHTGHVTERKKTSVFRPPALGAPICSVAPSSVVAATTGACDPAAGPDPRVSAPTGAMRS